MSKANILDTQDNTNPSWWRHFERNNSVYCSIEINEVIASKQTEHQLVEILRSKKYGDIIVSDGWLQSSEFDEFIYHESLVHPALCSVSRPIDVLIGGGGEGATLREVLKHPLVRRVTMVDIDRDFVQLCEQHIPHIHQGSFNDKRANVEFDDIASYLERTTKKFDAIILDLNAPSDGGNSIGLYSEKFYRLVKSRLSRNGVVSAYALSAQPASSSDFMRIQRSFQHVFGACEAITAKLPLDGDWCGFVVGFESEEARAQSIFANRTRVRSEIEKRSLFSRLKYFSEDTFIELTTQPRWVQDANTEASVRHESDMGEIGSETPRFPGLFNNHN